MPANPPSSGGKPPPRIPNIPFGNSLDSTFQQPRGTELVQDDVQVIYKSYSAPTYVRAVIGSAHPESSKFPEHTLLVILRDEQTQTDKLIYTVPRAASVSYQTTAEGQTSTVSQSLVLASSTPPTPTALRKVNFESLYNETARLTTTTVPSVFGNISRSVGTPEIIPQEFRAASGISTTRETVAGTVPATITLGVGEVERSEEQLDVFRKRVSLTAKSQVITPTLLGQEYDEQFDVPIPYIKTLEDSGTSLGDNRKEVTPLSDKLDLVKTISPDASVLDNYVLSFPTTTTVDIPDILTGITIMTETSTGAGTSTDQVDAASWSGAHSLTFPLRAEAQGSAAITGEVIPHLTPFYGVRREVTNYMFFLEAPVTSAAVTAKLETLTGLTVTNWASFKPGYVTIVLVAKRQSAQASAGTTVHQSSSDAGNASMISHSSGTSKELGMSVKTVRIPPTIHGDIVLKNEAGDPIASTITTSSNVAAHILGLVGTITISNIDVPITADASLRIIADGLSATDGPTSLPDTGLLIVNTTAAPYKYGRVRILAEVIDASTL